MGNKEDQFYTTLVTSYHDVLRFEETKRKYSRTTTSFRGRNTMEWLYSEGDKSCSEIADYLRITRPSASALITKLEALDYIQRYPSKNDGRCEMITLTRKGQLVTAYQTQHRKKMLDEIVKDFSSEELEIIKRGFSKMNQVFENCCENLEKEYKGKNLVSKKGNKKEKK